MTVFAEAAAAVDMLVEQLQALVEDARFVPRFFDTLFGLRTALGSARDRFAATPGEGDRPAYATVRDRSEQAVAIGGALTPDEAAVARYAAAVQRAIAALDAPLPGALPAASLAPPPAARVRPALRGALRIGGGARRTVAAPRAEPYYASLTKLFPVEAVTLYPLAIGIAAGDATIRLLLIGVIMLFVAVLRWFATQEERGGAADVPAIAVALVSFALYAAALGGFGYLPGGLAQTGQLLAFLTVMWVALVPFALRRARL
ncbi:hypothetical protein ASE95_16755 [Sphingomonas sp. Leaf231]|uniref:hypothetical protein n=1 Tax=Sphingomonas sp. Leaf231 TaxID=1736301 RepID=UPI0006FB1996|nr:hypothetical protein [Sphingomonas sp. Leaf231]KQN89821.1 hypothetical protein ASE95_16755 [Sphingomonas sp. Leaf231]